MLLDIAVRCIMFTIRNVYPFCVLVNKQYLLLAEYHREKFIMKLEECGGAPVNILYSFFRNQMGGGTLSVNILVFGGSPKGETSVTMQYVKWLCQNFPEHNLTVVQAAQPIRELEQDTAAIAKIGAKVQAADGILWAFPLYVAMPHAGLKRFVELISERQIGDAFRGKHCAILTTSIHFLDHTAIEYMRGISEDLGMVVDEVFSAEMQDLPRLGGTAQLAQFFRKWISRIQSGSISGRRTAPIRYESKPYTPTGQKPRVNPIKVGIVTQSGVSANLDGMVGQIAGHFTKTEIYDLSTMHIAGNCTGCLRCGYDNTCLYEGNIRDQGYSKSSNDCIPRSKGYPNLRRLIGPAPGQMPPPAQGRWCWYNPPALRPP